MELIPWRAGGFGSLRNEMNRLFEDFFGEDFGVTVRNGGWAPSVDLSETPEAYIVKAEVPGLDPKEIEVSVDQNVLTIRGERKEEKEEKGKTWLRTERRYGSFSRSIALPRAVDGDATKAEAKEGVLTITVPKQKQAVTKKVEVKTK